MDQKKSLIVLPALLFAVWILLSGSLHVQELIAGGVVAIVLTFLFGKSSVAGQVNLTPKAMVFAVAFLFVFSFELIKSNLDVAWRVLQPSLPIRPGIVKVKTKLNSKLGRVVLASSITLTPGTLTVETKDDNFYIHWINVQDGDVESTSRKLVETFEKYLEVIFG